MQLSLGKAVFLIVINGSRFTMRQGIGAEEHFAVIEQHSNVIGVQRRWLADGRAVGDVRGSERGGAAEVEISGEKLQANLERHK